MGQACLGGVAEARCRLASGPGHPIRDSLVEFDGCDCFSEISDGVRALHIFHDQQDVSTSGGFNRFVRR